MAPKEINPVCILVDLSHLVKVVSERFDMSARELISLSVRLASSVFD